VTAGPLNTLVPAGEIYISSEVQANGVRALAILSILVILALPFSSAQEPIVPVLALSMTPSAVNVKASQNESVSVQFNGTASVDKLPMVRVVVTLTSATDIGWVSQVSPTTMVFTSSGSQDYVCTVVIPVGSPSASGILMVNGRAVSMGLQSLAETKALITVQGVPMLNLSAGNHTQKNATSPAGPFKLGGSSTLTISVLGVVILCAAVAGFLLHRRTRQRRARAEAS